MKGVSEEKMDVSVDSAIDLAEENALLSESEDTYVEDDEAVGERKDEDLYGDDIFGEICRAIYQARYLAPILMVVGFAAAWSVIVAPYARKGPRSQPMSRKEFHMTRPMLDKDQMEQLKVNTREGETNFWMPLPSYDQIKIRFHAAAPKHGTHEPPEIFYQGVIFGLTDANSHYLDYVKGRGDEHTREDHRLLVEEVTRHRGSNDLLRDLEHMTPQPTAVFKRQVQNNATGWEEHGLAVYFSYDDLKKQGKWSTDKRKPYKRVLEDVLVVARHYRQVYVTAWYPHAFGKPHEDENDPHRHETIIQEVVPTRTGLYGIRSTVPVWMSAVNHTRPERKESKRRLRDQVYQKEWDDADHWDDYKPGGKNYRRLTEEEKKKYLSELIKPHGTRAMRRAPAKKKGDSLGKEL